MADRQTLLSLRCDVNLIRDSAFGQTREIASRMIEEIEKALQSVEPSSHSRVEIEDFSTDELVAEVAKRTNSKKLFEYLIPRLLIDRHVKKLCVDCHRRPARARERCTFCYKIAYIQERRT